MSISRRPTAARKPLRARAAALAPALQARRERLLQRHRLDAGLARPVSPGARPRWPVSARVCAGWGGVGLFLGWLQGLWPLAAVGGVALSAGVAWAFWRRPAASASVSAWDLAAAARFEQAVQAGAGQWPAAALASLERLQAALARLAPTLQAGLPGAPFRADDALFITELMRRYAPDSLEAYLRVPTAQRSQVLPGTDHSAADLLVQQLDELHAQLALREARVAEAGAEALRRQGDFLRHKRSD